MAAIHALPIEILTRIFLLGLPEGEYPDFPLIGVPGFELQVSHVCQHWRQIALRTPHLWSTIHLRTIPHMERAKQYLRRSTRALLNIMVDTCDAEEHIPGFLLFREEFMPVFAILIPYISRWRSLQIKVRDRQCKLGARQVLSTCGEAPRLEYLQLWHVETWETTERLFTQIGPPPVVIFDKSLPSLRHISLIGVNVPWVHSPFLEDLTSIEFGLHANDVRIPYNLWERMLVTSPHLEKLSLHYSGPKGSPETWSNGAAKLSYLHELVLEEMVPSTLVQILRRICIPHLAILRLNLPSLDDGEDCTCFLEYLVSPPPPLPVIRDDVDDRRDRILANTNKEKGKARVHKHAPRPIFRELETLVLIGLECTAESFGQFLRVSQTVKHLEFDGAKLSDGLFEEFMRVHSVEEDDEPVRREGSEETGSSSSGDEGSRESSVSSDSGSSTTTESASTTPASPGPEFVSSEIVLPELITVRVSGLSSEQLRAFIEFRRAHGCPVRRWRVSELMRDEVLERVAEEMEKAGDDERIVWEEDEGEEEEDDYVYEDEDDGVEEKQEDDVQDVGVTAAVPGVSSNEEVGGEDEPEEYSEDEDDEDDEEE